MINMDGEDAQSGRKTCSIGAAAKFIPGGRRSIAGRSTVVRA